MLAVNSKPIAKKVPLLTVKNNERMGNRLTCVRELDHLSIYVDAKTGRFLLFDNGVTLRFNELYQANKVALERHYQMIDKQNQQWSNALF